MAIDTATQAFLADLAAGTPAGTPPLWEMTPAEARAAGGGLRDLYGPGPRMRRVEDHALTGHDGGPVRVRV